MTFDLGLQLECNKGKENMGNIMQSFSICEEIQKESQTENERIGTPNLIVDKNASEFSPLLIPKKTVCLSQSCEDIQPSSCSLIVFDLETSGLGVFQAEILQIAAVWELKEFNAYVNPMRDIPFETSAVNHLTVVNGILHHKGDAVDSRPLINVLSSFLQWLKDIPSPRILLGHNIKCFDCRHFFASLSQHNLVTEFCELVIGFIDTFPLYRDINPGMRRYKQNNLVMTLLQKSFDEHNAIEDVKALQQLILFSKISDSIFLKHSFTSNSMWDVFQFSKEKKRILESYTLMKYKKGISKGMADKFSSNGITCEDLEVSFKKGGKDELKRFLGEKVDGKVRGTKNNKVIDGIVNYLENEMGFMLRQAYNKP